MHGLLFVARGTCRECAATVRRGALRCRVCGSLLPALDLQRLLLIVLALTGALAALLVALWFL